MTQAKLIGIDSADWDASCDKYRQTGLFGCYFQASIGPDDAKGAELFGFTACNREWAECMVEEGQVLPKLLVVNDVSFEEVERAVELVCAAVPQGSWDEVARKLAEVMDWEFDGYVPGDEADQR